MTSHLLKPLDLYTLPLRGTQLVEASAGTGKTWTIAGLYLRLLLETDASIDRLLVVTFTKAATAELRDRLRARVAEVLAAFAAGHSDDAFCQWALSRFDGAARAQAAEKLAHALRVFDEAAIFTIHGFCQRVLGDVQLPELLTEPDIVPDERDWLPGLVQEAWIRHCTHPELAAVLAAGELEAATIERDVTVLLLKPFLQLEAGSLAVSAEQLAAQREALAVRWQAQHPAILADIREADGLSRAKGFYKEEEVDELLHMLVAWMEGRGGLSAALRRLTPERFLEKRKQKGRLPQHGFWQALADWFAAADSLLRAFRHRLIDDVRAALAAHKRERGLVSYQDLLALLAQAVTDPRLAAAIRARYSAALIDEFQDTDPLQFRIFATLFGPEATHGHHDVVVSAEAGTRSLSGDMANGVASVADEGDEQHLLSATGEAAEAFPLYLVGDPKQAIYSFRGADIFTYLRARESAAGRYTLGTNRRSVPALVQAVNALFTRNSNPFLFSDLRFPPVDAVAPAVALTPETPPLQCWLLPDAGSTAMAKKEAMALSVQATVAEIVQLLQGAARGEVAIGASPLRPGDIAVLVAKHAEGRAVVAALAEAGVPAVIRSIDSVFATAEARELLAVLEAVVAPGREGVVKAAMLTPLWGGTVDSVHAAQEDEAGWSALVGQLLAARERWQQQGFMPMWEQWQEDTGVLARVLAAPEGERRLTNLRHLATLMQQQADIDPVPERQIAWLREQLREAVSTEDTQLRLESDAARVQVLTIHVSKGLEYPVVFCPFLWDGSLLHKSDSDRAEYRAGAESRLDLGSERFAQAKTRMATERLAEKLRVLYVALTRAKYRCYALWGRVKDSELAALSWLLLGDGIDGEAQVDVLAPAIKAMGHGAYVAALKALAAAVPQGVAWRELDMLPAPVAPV
ncbi:MAG: UvrD-helicase domain-containing protein, partial [Moraxellaceae bacterium]